MTETQQQQQLPANIRTIGGIAKRDGATTNRPKRAPPPPPELSKPARKIWTRLVHDLIEANAWRPHYRDHVAGYCSLLAEFYSNPAGFPATKHTVKQRYEANLFLTPASDLDPNRKQRRPNR